MKDEATIVELLRLDTISYTEMKETKNDVAELERLNKQGLSPVPYACKRNRKTKGEIMKFH